MYKFTLAMTLVTILLFCMETANQIKESDIRGLFLILSLVSGTLAVCSIDIIRDINE